MKNNILTYILVIVTSIFLHAGVAYAGVPEAITYLETQDNNAMKSIALIANGSLSDITFLKTVDTSKAINIAKPIMAIVAGGEDPRTYGNTDLVKILKNLYDGTQMDDVGTINDDFWAILALVAAGEIESREVTGMVEFVRNNQNSDGGWSWGVGEDSDTDDTAIAVIALRAAGVSSSDIAITKAKNYISLNQNSDGGFLSNPLWGSDSNSATDAWVIMMIHALDEDIGAWSKDGKTPVDHVLSLQDADGGFWWVNEGTSDWNNKGATADIIIGLLGHSLPTNIMTYVNSGVSVSYRFEGSAQTICEGETTVVTVQDIIDKASVECPFEKEYTVYDFGSMLTRINEDTGNWMYFVNNKSAVVGSADYTLANNDDVLWYFAGSDWGWLPTRLFLNADGDMYSIGDTLTGNVEYFDENDNSWVSLESATVQINGDEYTTDINGKFTVTITTPGVFEIVAEKEGYIRSAVETIAVGESSESVLLTAEIVESVVGNPNVDAPTTSIGFTITPTYLLFGQIAPGMNVTKQVSIQNVGTNSITMRAQIVGNSIFNFIKILNEAWNDFESLLGVGEEQTIDVSLSVPTAYASYGNKEGNLIFWAVNAE